MKIIISIFIFFIVFGPKISFLDTSFFIPFAIAFYYAFSRKKHPIKVNETLFGIILLMFLYIIYILMIYIFMNASSTDLILRSIRASLAVFCIILFSEVLRNSSQFSINILVIFSFFHTLLVIYIAQFSPQTQIFLDDLFGNFRIAYSDVKMRSSGLFAGYEIAGIFSLFGMMSICFKKFSAKNIVIDIVFMGIFLIGCYFTSRTIMVLGIFIIFFYLARYIFVEKSKKAYEKLSVIVLFTPFAIYAMYKMIFVIQIALNFGIFDIPLETQLAIAERFSGNTLGDSGLFSMYFLPNSDIHRIFGLGVDAVNSDVGYVKIIFWSGFVGLSILILMHLLLLKNSLVFCISFDDRMFIMAIYFIVFALSLKNNYILTRGVWPLLLILYVVSSSGRLRGPATLPFRAS